MQTANFSLLLIVVPMLVGVNVGNVLAVTSGNAAGGVDLLNNQAVEQKQKQKQKQMSVHVSMSSKATASEKKKDGTLSILTTSVKSMFTNKSKLLKAQLAIQNQQLSALIAENAQLKASIEEQRRRELAMREQLEQSVAAVEAEAGAVAAADASDAQHQNGGVPHVVQAAETAKIEVIALNDARLDGTSANTNLDISADGLTATRSGQPDYEWKHATTVSAISPPTGAAKSDSFALYYYEYTVKNANSNWNSIGFSMDGSYDGRFVSFFSSGKVNYVKRVVLDWEDGSARFGHGSVVGVGLVVPPKGKKAKGSKRAEAFVTVDGVLKGKHYTIDANIDAVWPLITLGGEGTSVEVNFGHNDNDAGSKRFMYNIEGHRVTYVERAEMDWVPMGAATAAVGPKNTPSQ